MASTSGVRSRGGGNASKVIFTTPSYASVREGGDFCDFIVKGGSEIIKGYVKCKQWQKYIVERKF